MFNSDVKECKGFYGLNLDAGMIQESPDGYKFLLNGYSFKSSAESDFITLGQESWNVVADHARTAGRRGNSLPNTNT